MSGQIGLYLVAILGVLWSLLISGIWLLLYSYGEQNETTPVPSE